MKDLSTASNFYSLILPVQPSHARPFRRGRRAFSPRTGARLGTQSPGLSPTLKENLPSNRTPIASMVAIEVYIDDPSRLIRRSGGGELGMRHPWEAPPES
jgi:hypothetical protein